jgi:hypothetical protein
MGEIPKKMVVTSFLEKNLIFQNLMKLKEPLNININAIEYKGQIVRHDSNTLIVKMTSPYIGDIDGLIRTNFIFHNNYHYFDSRAHHLDEDRIILDIPTQINKNMLRKYERVYVFGNVFMKMKIMIQSEKYDFKSSSLLDERVIFKEVKKPRPAIDKILNGIKQLVSDFSQIFQLKVFKPGQKATLEEQLLKDTKKIFLIYDSYEDNIKEKRFFEEGILTIGGAYAYMTARGDPVKAAEGKLLDLLQLKRNQKIFSECYVPLLLEGEAVGYIRLVNTVDYHRSIKPAFAIRTAGYANILIEALVKYDYFRLDSGKEFEIPVINISAGGILFKLDESRLKNYIIVRTILQMSIRFPERQVETRGVVYRIDEEASEYGVKFQEINENDIRYIESIVKRGVSL